MSAPIPNIASESTASFVVHDPDWATVAPLPAWPFAAMRDLGQHLATANAKLANVEALIAHARKVSPSDRMVVYVGDLLHALGLADEKARTKLGDNDGSST